METRLTRRQLQRLALTLPAPLALAVLTGRQAGITLAQDDDPTATATAEPTATASGTPVLAPTPACTDDDDDLDETLSQTEGPFFTPDSPERTSLLDANMPGTKLVVTGYVYTTDCRPVENALLDFWHADDAGAYDNVGYRLGGHQFTDADGRFELTTIMPGLYSGRTRHIHVKAQAPNQPVLTTQLYFPDEPGNASDGIFDPALVIELDAKSEHDDADEGELGFFTFVLEA